MITKEEVELKFKEATDSYNSFVEQNPAPYRHAWMIMGDGKLHPVFVPEDSDDDL